MRILIVEDSPERIKSFKRKFIGHIVEITRDPDEAIDLLKTKSWDYLFLDHDLGHEEGVESGPGTGYQVALFIHQNPSLKPSKGIVLHSLNVVGRQNMKKILPEAVESPFCWN